MNSSKHLLKSTRYKWASPVALGRCGYKYRKISVSTTSIVECVDCVDSILLLRHLHVCHAARRSIEDQSWVYRTVATQLTEELGVDGRECVLRFMCDLQAQPIHSWTLAGQVLGLVFT